MGYFGLLLLSSPFPLESFHIHTGWFDMTCCVNQQLLTLLILLCLNGRKSLLPCFIIECKTFPEIWKLLQQQKKNKLPIDAHGFEMNYSASTWYGPHTFGCCLCWYEEGTKYWTMRYPSSCDSDNLSLHKLLFHKLLYMLKKYLATLPSVITH